MGTEYQIFNWKEYVSLKRFWNMEWKYKTEKAKNEELEKENKNLKECNKNQSEVINNVFIPQRERLEEENKKLKEELEKWKKDYRERIIVDARNG